VRIFLVTNGPRCEDGDHWANAFSAAANDVVPQLIDQLNVRIELFKDCRIDPRHILRG